jgi:hypothetical protein
MPLTVGEIVTAPDLRLELLSEGDLERPVRWVHATDQPDPTPYLRGGEVVLTDGLWLGGGTSPVDYVRRLADARAAAIGFGLIAGGPEVPRPLIDACRRRRMTMFAVPEEVPFLAISELFVESMLAERDAAHQEALRQTHLRFAAELFELVRDGPGQSPAVAERLRGLGLDPEGGLVAIACDLPDAEARLTEFERALRVQGLRQVAIARAGRLLAIAECHPGQPVEPLAAALSAELGDLAAVGVGAPVASATLLDVSLAEAHRACLLARTRQDGRRTATARELASHAGLLAQQDAEVLERFRADLLGPIEEHDLAKGSELLSTLEEFLFSGGRWAQTARRLHVHVNTLRHRLARIEELTGRRIEDPDDRVDFHLALRAARAPSTKRNASARAAGSAGTPEAAPARPQRRRP